MSLRAEVSLFVRPPGAGAVRAALPAEPANGSGAVPGDAANLLGCAARLEEAKRLAEENPAGTARSLTLRSRLAARWL